MRSSVWLPESRTTCWLLQGVLLAIAPVLGSFSRELPGLLEPKDEVYLSDALQSLQTGRAALLRSYQAEAVRRSWMAPLGRSILELAPGAGKTRIMEAIIAAGVMMGYNGALLLVHSPAIATQTEDDLRRMMKPLLCCCGVTELEKPPPVLCTTYERLSRMPQEVIDEAMTYGMLLIDEVHTAGRRTAVELILQSRAQLRVGLSGTALERMDDRNPLVVGLLGPVVMRMTPADVVEDGHLAEGKLH